MASVHSSTEAGANSNPEQEDDVIHDAIPISYAYPVDYANEVPPSTSKRKRGTPKRKQETNEKLSDDWEVKETPRAKDPRVDKTYHHKTDGVTLRSKVGALYYQKHGTFPPKKSKTEGKKTQNTQVELPAAEE